MWSREAYPRRPRTTSSLPLTKLPVYIKSMEADWSKTAYVMSIPVFTATHKALYMSIKPMAMCIKPVGAKIIHSTCPLLLTIFKSSKYQSECLTLYKPLPLSLRRFPRHLPIRHKHQIIHKSLCIRRFPITNTPTDHNDKTHLLSLFIHLEAVLWRANIVIGI
jgi:hypothetical protein